MGIKVKARANELVLFYATGDDAVIREESDLTQYIETHDVGHLVFEIEDEDADQFGPVKFWCKIPEWEEAEPMFWEVYGNPIKFAHELFRRYCEKIENFRWRDKKGKIQTVFAARVREPGIGMVLREPVLKMIPLVIQYEVGTGIALLGGLLKDAEDAVDKLSKEIDAEIRVIPGEQEKNSLASASSGGSTEKTSGADAVSNDPISETA